MTVPEDHNQESYTRETQPPAPTPLSTILGQMRQHAAAMTTAAVAKKAPIAEVYSSEPIYHKGVAHKIVNIPSTNSEKPKGPKTIHISIKYDATSIKKLVRVPIMEITITPMKLIHELNRIAREEGMECSVHSSSGKIDFRLTNRPEIKYTRDTMLPQNVAFIEALILRIAEINASEKTTTPEI